MSDIVTIEPSEITTLQSETVVGARKVNTSAGTSRGDVSAQWLSRPADQKFLNLNDLRDSVLRRAQVSREQVVAPKALTWIAPEPRTLEDTHRLSIGLPGGDEVSPTHYSFGQLASLASAPASYLRTLPSQLVRDNLRWGYRHREDEVKAYWSKETGELHAATGAGYGRIYDHEVVAAVQQIAGNGTGDQRWKVPGVLDWKTLVYDPNAPVTPATSTLFASDRDVFIFLVDDLHPISIGTLPNGEPDYVFRGFYVTNSEVGKSALKVAAFYLRAVCCNRILWGVEGFQEVSLRHTKTAPARFIEEIRPALLSYSQGSEIKLQQAVQQAREAVVAKDDDEALAFLRAREFPVSTAKAVLARHEAEEGRPARSIWDLAQGITAVARDIPHTDDRLDLERTAQTLLDKAA